MRTVKALLSLAVALLVWTIPASAEVRLHGLFTDGMVLQQDQKVPVCGTADDGEQVTVKFADQETSTTAAGGKWMVKLNDLKPGGPFTMTVSGKNTIVLKDVYVGEVWICSGQSNMALILKQSANADQEIANSANPMIRLYSVPGKAADEPASDVHGQWKACAPDTVANFSAVGYFFGREIQKALKVPVGLINSSVGGTPAEAWTSHEALESKADLKTIGDDYARALQDLPQAIEQYNKDLPTYNAMADKMRKAGKTPPPPPRKPGPPVKPSCLYNGMIAPLIHYGIAGVIWYQGESNASRALQYRTLFPTMIEDWRKAWGQDEFPFLYVQLAPYRPIQAEPQLNSNWAELREAQLVTLSVPKTGMAVITDAGDPTNIHPTNKQIVGARLALAALAIAYGRNIEYSGPIYSSMKIAGDKVVLSFTHVGGGLEAKGGELKGFAIAGPDRKFVWARAKIAGDNVVAWSPLVPSPSYVRYGWADCPVCNLYNKEGLPASPFRTNYLDVPVRRR